LVAEANLSPLDPRSYCLLGSVVRRFDAFMFEEGDALRTCGNALPREL
jgi:hypothetical protein